MAARGRVRSTRVRGQSPDKSVAAVADLAIAEGAMSGDCPRTWPREPWPLQGRLRGGPSGYVGGVLLLIVALILTGSVVGALARLALPGPDPMPIWATILLGWAGSLVGGIVSGLLLGRPAGIIVSVLAATLVLYLYRRFVQHRPLTGSGARRPPAP